MSDDTHAPEKRTAAVLLIFIVTALSFTVGVLSLPESAKTLPVRPAFCDAPPLLTKPEVPFPRLNAALALRREVRILVSGSGSTIGPALDPAAPANDNAADSTSFINWMLSELQHTNSSARFDLTKIGGRGLTADEMLPLLRAALQEQRFDLLIWETGTVDALRGVNPKRLQAVLREGIIMASSAGTDVILIEPQYTRFFKAQVDLDLYQAQFRKAAADGRAALFRRFELTQGWSDGMMLDPEKVGREKGPATVLALNQCVGHVLAGFVLEGGRGAP